MNFKHLALATLITLGGTSVTHATQLQPATEIKKEASIIKNVVALKERELQLLNANQNTSSHLLKTPKSTVLQSEDERRAIASLTGKTPKIGRVNKFDSFIQNLFGG